MNHAALRHKPYRNHRRTLHRGGFTLLEVLVALLLLAAISAGLLSLTRTTLGFTGLTTSIATSVREVAEAEGYLADAFRSAKFVYGDMTIRVGGTNLVCETIPADVSEPVGRCISLLTPVTDTALGHQPIVDFDLSVFRVEEIGTRFDAFGVPQGFMGPETLALVEYRIPNVCAIVGSAPCAAPPGGLDTLSPALAFGGEVGLLVTGISAADASGTVVPTFAVEGGEATTRRLTLRLLTRANSRFGQPFTIRETPVELQVSVRGLAQASE